MPVPVSASTSVLPLSQTKNPSRVISDLYKKKLEIRIQKESIIKRGISVSVLCATFPDCRHCARGTRHLCSRLTYHGGRFNTRLTRSLESQFAQMNDNAKCLTAPVKISIVKSLTSRDESGGKWSKKYPQKYPQKTKQ